MVVYYLLYPENMKVRECDILLPVYVLHECHEEAIKKSAISLIEATVHHPKMAAFFNQNHGLINGLQHVARSANPLLSNLAKESLKTIMLGRCMPRSAPPPYMNYKEKANALSSLEVSTASTALPSAVPSPVQRRNRLGDESGFWMEPMEGAGEQIPEDFAIGDDPFVNVFCPTAVPQSSPPFSPSMNHSDMSDNALATNGEDAMQINSPQGPSETWDSPDPMHYSECGGYMATQMPTTTHPHHVGAAPTMGLYDHHHPSPMLYSTQPWHPPQMPAHPHSSDLGMYSMHDYYSPQNPPYLPPNPEYMQRYDQYHSQYGRFH
ncbi:hypothetical protein GCK32_009252 [Trichostrongylus colubriformis]|uniref:Uncharacterized protein n=1 Tax=Trichostrongylus colubriformis TaxID=6319 RepID=A0AAN8F9N8_TRICO